MEGDTEAVTDDLRQNMQRAADKLEFERAAVLRDRIRGVEKVAEEQRIKVDSNPISDMDLLAVAQGTNESWVEVFFIRHNKLIGRDHFIMEGTKDESPGLVLGQFIKQFYQSAASIPPHVLVQHPVEDSEVIREWLRGLRGKSVRLMQPQRGVHKQLIDTVGENAVQGLAQHRVKWLDNADVIQQAMEELQEELSLPASPHRMECYDISHIQGSNSVGSMVVFENGRPKPAHYRRFKVKSVEGVDDYESMREVLRRRFRRLGQSRMAQSASENGSLAGQDDTWGILPDLVLIDGGKGQLSAALGVLLELGLDDLPLASLAKEKRMAVRPPHAGAHSIAPQFPGPVPGAADSRRSSPLRYHLPSKPPQQEQPSLSHRHGDRHRSQAQTYADAALRHLAGHQGGLGG